MKWDYDAQEILADGIVHALGVAAAAISLGVLVYLTAQGAGLWEFAAIVVYGLTLLTALSISAVYNLWPPSRVKWILRRFDHSAIFLLIAGTYTPFITQMEGSGVSVVLFAGIWTTTAIGISLKLCFPGKFDRLAVALYVLLGWSGVLAFDAVFGSLPASTLWLLCTGGILYTGGVVFHLWESLRFQNAIWHAFVLAGATCHFGAIITCFGLA